MTREEAIKLINEIYTIAPDFPWDGDDVTCVFRHRVSKKWFGLLMEVRPKSLGMAGAERISVMNLKAERTLIPDLTMEKGILPAYHMSKQHWISVILADMDKNMLSKLLEMSFNLTRTRKDV